MLSPLGRRLSQIRVHEKRGKCGKGAARNLTRYTDLVLRASPLTISIKSVRQTSAKLISERSPNS